MSDPQAPGFTPSPDEAPSVAPAHEDPTPPDAPTPVDPVPEELGGSKTVEANDELTEGGVER